MNLFIPMNREEVRQWRWSELDIVLVTGDAYVDHPSFGAAVIGRFLISGGFRVGIISQPMKDEDFQVFGPPRLFFAVTGGNMDSMVCHYTSFKRLRHDDAYTPGNSAGSRPDYAVISYCQALRRIYKGINLVIGGIEASLRRLAHYDFWSERIKHSILLDAKADILVYGMGEYASLEIARCYDTGRDYRAVKGIAWVATRREDLPQPPYHQLIDYNSLQESPDRILEMTQNYLKWLNSDQPVLQASENRWVVINPSRPPLTTEELDAIYDLPYRYLPHPSYKKSISAFDMIQFSITISRGCPGGCSFCALNMHQGRIVQSRSIDSIAREIFQYRQQSDFKGIIKDLGAPTANVYQLTYSRPEICSHCNRYSCLHPHHCPHFPFDNQPLIGLYRTVRALPGIRKAFVNSGIRWDLTDESYFEELIRYHISGQLKFAPEHVVDSVLDLMHKPPADTLFEFIREFERINRRFSLNQYLIPYFMSGFPGCRNQDMQAVVNFLRKWKFQPQQVQAFLPIPMTLATAMYVAEKEPNSGRPLYVAKKESEKRDQRDSILYLKQRKAYRSQP